MRNSQSYAGWWCLAGADSPGGHGCPNAENRYGRDLDHYRYTARSRYRRLIDRCPQVVQMLSLKDIASFLNITPIYLSKLRKEITFGKT